jgi:hypothetical protein
MSSGKQAAKRRAASEDPIPYFLPISMFNAVRDNLTWKVLDNNSNNELNDHSAPLQIHREVGSSTVRGVLYFSDLLKSFVMHIVSSLRWYVEMPCIKPIKSRSANATSDAYTKTLVKVLYLPTEADLREQHVGSAELGHLLKLVRFFNTALGCTTAKDCDLLLGNVISQSGLNAKGELYDVQQLATPSNVVKVSRLEDVLGYTKYIPTGDLMEACRLFCKSEKRRVICAQGKSSRVTDVGLRQLDPQTSKAYNEKVVARFADSLKKLGVQDEPVSTLVSTSSAVTPAIVKMYDIASANRVNKSSTTNAKKRYRDMIEEYKTLSGYKLDIATEMQDGTLQHRLNELRWATRMAADKQQLVFWYDTSRDRLVAMDGIVGSDQRQQRVVPQQVESDSASRSETLNVTTQSPLLYDDTQRLRTLIPGRMPRVAGVDAVRQVAPHVQASSQHVQQRTTVSLLASHIIPQQQLQSQQQRPQGTLFDVLSGPSTERQREAVKHAVESATSRYNSLAKATTPTASDKGEGPVPSTQQASIFARGHQHHVHATATGTHREDLADVTPYYSTARSFDRDSGTKTYGRNERFIHRARDGTHERGEDEQRNYYNDDDDDDDEVPFTADEDVDERGDGEEPHFDALHVRPTLAVLQASPLKGTDYLQHKSPSKVAATSEQQTLSPSTTFGTTGGIDTSAAPVDAVADAPLEEPLTPPGNEQHDNEGVSNEKGEGFNPSADESSTL